MHAPAALHGHLLNGGFQTLEGLPAALPAEGFLWLPLERERLEQDAAALQDALVRWGCGALVDLHLSDLLNPQLPSQHDYTSWYDLLVFRRLRLDSAAAEAARAAPRAEHAARRLLAAVDTSPVGFAVYDRVLITVHPQGCAARDFFQARLQQLASGQAAQASGSEGRPASGRLPRSPAELMLRIVNHLVDSYLDLRRELSRELGSLQAQLLSPRGRFDHWPALLETRNTLHSLEDACEDQRTAVQEWIDALAEWPAAPGSALAQEHELLRVRSRDVLEHIERVLGHVRRLESSAEGAVQMHFSAQANRTNEIMRTLTVLTAIFLPLNLVTGFFGMNFDALPLVHQQGGVWIALGLMAALGLGLFGFFWRKRYLSRGRLR